MSIYTKFKPTRLYIKKHIVTGMLYFGCSTKQDIDKYYGSGKYWCRHINTHGKQYVRTIWVSGWFDDPDAIQEFALAFSELFDIEEDDSWANLKKETGLPGGGAGKAGYIKAGASQSKTKNDPEWICSVGKEQSRKIKQTLNDPSWKATTGAEKAAYLSKQRADPVWQATKGAEAKAKHKATINDPVWKATKGVALAKRSSEVQNDPEWKAIAWKTCQHCSKCVSPGNYVRWHGDNCKLLKS